VEYSNQPKEYYLSRKQILSTYFMRKYIHMAKEVKPQLSEDASDYISERYAELRSADMGRTDLERVGIGMQIKEGIK
jgi:DNA replicative helicase MCM subunit Mcm2 (Cdc46/Mcm family)